MKLIKNMFLLSLILVVYTSTICMERFENQAEALPNVPAERTLTTELRAELFEAAQCVTQHEGGLVDMLPFLLEYLTRLPPDLAALIGTALPFTRTIALIGLTLPLYARTFARGFLDGLHPLNGTAAMVRDVYTDVLRSHYYKAGVRLAGHLSAHAGTVVGVAYMLPHRTKIIAFLLLLRIYRLRLLMKMNDADMFLAVTAAFLWALASEGIKPERVEAKVLLTVILALYTAYRMRLVLHRAH